MTVRKPNTIDVHVGSRVRLKRMMSGMSQEKLGETLGITFQQVQKYERGANRVGAGRLYEMAKALEVPVDFFFEDLPEGPSATTSPAAAVEEAHSHYEGDLMSQLETLALVRSYYDIEDPAVRRRMMELIKAISAADKKEEGA